MSTPDQPDERSPGDEFHYTQQDREVAVEGPSLTIDPTTGMVTQINDYALELRFIQSPRWDKVGAAFIAAKLEFMPILKQAENDFFKTKYAELEDVLASVDPSLGKHGLFLQQPTWVNQYGVQVLFTRIMHPESQQWLGSLAKLTPLKADPQGEGTVLTYARRYQAQTLLGVAAKDVDGAVASQAPKPPKREPSGRDWLAEAQKIAGKDGPPAQRRKDLIALIKAAEQAQEATTELSKDLIAIGKTLKAEIEMEQEAAKKAKEAPKEEEAPADPPGELPDTPPDASKQASPDASKQGGEHGPEGGWPETAKPGSGS
jgi:hypothetical protein